MVTSFASKTTKFLEPLALERELPSRYLMPGMLFSDRNLEAFLAPIQKCP